MPGSHPKEGRLPGPPAGCGRVLTWVSWSWDPRDVTSLASLMALPSASLSMPVTLSTSFWGCQETWLVETSRTGSLLDKKKLFFAQQDIPCLHGIGLEVSSAEESTFGS
jgi:hypothetical protein